MHHPRTGVRLSLLLLVVVAVGGLPLHSFLGDQFLSDYSLRPVVIASIFVVLAVLLLMAIEAHSSELRRRLPTAWVRWLAWPIFTLALAGVLFLSSRGWLAGLSRLLAQDQATAQLTVLRVSRHETRRTLCHQYLEFQYKVSAQRLCADSLLVEGRAVAGRTLLASGVASPLGFHVQALRLQ